jgi:hypothetical protein
MGHIGIDVPKKESPICLAASRGLLHWPLTVYPGAAQDSLEATCDEGADAHVTTEARPATARCRPH